MLPKHPLTGATGEPIGLLIAAARRGIKQAIGSRLHGSGLSPQQFWLLTAIAEHPGLSLTALCTRRRMDPPTASRVVAALAAKRLLVVGDDGADRRRCRLELTGKGRTLAERLRPLLEEQRRTLVRGMSPAEQEALRGLLRRAIENLDASAGPRDKLDLELEPRHS